MATPSKVLRELADEGLWRLPKPRAQGGQTWHPTRLHHPVAAPLDVPALLQDQNHNAQALLRAIAIDAVIAWRIMLLALLGREVPELPCAALFNPVECDVPELLAKKKDRKQRSLGQAPIMIAQLGGYLDRKCDRVPGFESLWRGHARFCDMVKIIALERAAKSKCQIKRCVTHASPMRHDGIPGQAQG